MLKPVAVDVLMPLMASSLDAAVQPAAAARTTASSLLAKFADHDAAGAVQLLDDATSAEVRTLVSDMSNVATTINAAHQVMRSSGMQADTFTDSTVRRIVDGAERLASLRTSTPRDVYMAAVGAEKTAKVMEYTLRDLRAIVDAAT